MIATESSVAARRVVPFVPHLRLYAETVLVDTGTPLQPSYQEVEAAVMSLVFDYEGTRLRPSDPQDRFFAARSGTMALVERDRLGEARVQCLLESFGAVELGCVDGYVTDLDSTADYLVHPGGNVHTLCSFTAHAVPQLRSHGISVSLDADYPYQVVEGEPGWYASIDADDEGSDWFSLELGVEVGGRKLNLLPALLALIEQCPDARSLERLLSAPGRYRALPAGEGRYLAVPPERLRGLVKILLELYQGSDLSPKGRLHFHDLQAASLIGLEGAVGAGALRWEGATHVTDRGRALAELPKPPTKALPTPGLTATLRPYQQAGLFWLQHLRAHDAGGILADDMGLGKTLQTIAHLLLEKRSGRMQRPSLVVMPTSLIGNWRRELLRFAPSLRVCVLHGPKRRKQRASAHGADVWLTTYPVLVRDKAWFGEHDYHLVILDEAQAIKNPRSQAHRAVAELQSQHRMCLTGTPLENNLEELWSQFAFLMPGLLGDLGAFKNRFALPIERDGNGRQLEVLRQIVSPFVLRRMKEQVAPELPPKTELVRPVELLGDQRDLYESIRVAAHGEVRKAIRKKGLAASAITILDALMQLRQVCCDPRLVRVDSARSVEGSAKFELLMQMLESQLPQGRRVLVFSQFTRMLALISEGLLARGIRHVSLTGATVDRQRRIDAFERGDADVFLISLKAGGAGLNLVSADTVVHYDPWWNAAAQAQATDRAYRIGQTKPVFVHSLIVAGSVEERMLRLQQRKRALADSILGGSGPEAPALSLGDVEDLFGPLDD